MTDSSHPNASLAPVPKSRKKLVIVAIIVAIILLIVGLYFWFNRPIQPVVLSDGEQRVLDQKIELAEERNYEKGAKVLVLTEREVNALFHENTGMGAEVKFEFANDAVHARVVKDLDPDFPILGGKKLKARARFMMTDENDNPAIILDDLTVWGISLPNAWLADLKGQNLISNLGIDSNKSQIGKGIQNIEVKNGEIMIELAE
ncbi:MAG: hypothetical protein ACSHX0_11300 [Akkermansiaceae bacterium]